MCKASAQTHDSLLSQNGGTRPPSDGSGAPCSPMERQGNSQRGKQRRTWPCSCEEGGTGWAQGMGSQQDVFDSPGTAQRASALFWSRFPSTALGAGLHRTLGGSSCCPPVGTIIYLSVFSSLFFVLGGCFPQESLLRPRHTAAGKYPRKASRDPWGNTASILAGSGPECAWTAGGGNWVTELAQLYCSAFLLFPPLTHA